MDRPTPPTWHRKVRYHHGHLRDSALARGREIVTRHGPLALTLRGLARDLGVSATALVRQFRNIAGLRAAVAEHGLRAIVAASSLDPRSPATSTRAAAIAWVDFAAANAGLYRLVAGETWHEREARSGYHGVIRVPSPRVYLENTLAHGRRQSHLERARGLAIVLHGLALARIDGAPADDVARELDRAVQAFAPL
ncbi:MAG: TetR/AcrR family transcriptional regulator [Myxococcota bacterium]